MKKSFKRIFVSSLTLAVTLLFVSSALHAQQDSSPEMQGKTVLELLKSKGNTSKFAGLLEESGYSQVIKKKGPYTILAPSNEAIEQADPKLKENPRKLMKGQIFQGEVSKKQVESQMGVKIQETDDSASNGIIYVTDKVVNQ